MTPQLYSQAYNKASHQNLVRFFKPTEGNAGEYDVVKAPAGTAPEDTIYQITAHFQTKDGVAMCNPRTSPHCAGASGSGISLAYASCHCHAPACISVSHSYPHCCATLFCDIVHLIPNQVTI